VPTIDQLGGTELVKDNDLLPVFQPRNRRTRNLSVKDLADYFNQTSTVVSVDGRVGVITLNDLYAPFAHVGSGGTQHALVVDGGAAGFMSGAQSAKLAGIQAGAQNNTASNSGAGAQVFRTKTLSDLSFRSIISGSTNVTVTQNANDISIAVQSADLLNTLRIDVASAATVNLTSLAPNTRNINITGTSAITAFTVAAGQTYFVRFNAALTLTNNAAIVTQTGGNIVTAAGDTCIIRSTAANVVEVLSYTPFAYPFLRIYTSPEQTITLGGTVNLSHLLGATPSNVQLSIICKTAELGFAVNDEAPVNVDANNNSTGIMVGRNATTLRAVVGAAGVYVLNASGAVALITPANWRFIVRASL
jgi:hypothetical protein